MNVFRELASEIFHRLANSTENEIRQLLQERVRQHFDM
jgi:hypothetical protein